jgi:hypothetical protein
MGVIIDDKSRTWRAGPPPKERVLDLNSAAVTAALTLHPEVWISGFGEATEAQLNEVFRAEFPTVTFRMSREKLSDGSDEEDTRFGSGGLESLVMKEAGMGIFDQNGDDDGAPKKVRASHSGVLHWCMQWRSWPYHRRALICILHSPAATVGKGPRLRPREARKCGGGEEFHLPVRWLPGRWSRRAEGAGVKTGAAR